MATIWWFGGDLQPGDSNPQTETQAIAGMQKGQGEARLMTSDRAAPLGQLGVKAKVKQEQGVVSRSARRRRKSRNSE